MYERILYKQMPFAKIKKVLNNHYSEQYGSIRGFLRSKKYLFLYYIGKYKKYQRINWQDVNRLVFVCKGNICRSAFAEAVANSLSIEAVSFGIDTHDKMPADDAAIYSAKLMGVKLDNHRTTSFASFEHKPGDLFVAMEPSHINFLEYSGSVNGFPITLVGLWSAKVRPHIEDPYGKPLVYFANCFDYLDKSVHAIKDKLPNAK